MPNSANLTETGVSGKYGRVLVAGSNGIMVPVNFETWSITPEVDDVPWNGFENAGWKDGLSGMAGWMVSLKGPYQVARAGGTTAAFDFLTPGRRCVVECWLIHPDWSSLYGTFLRYTGVAQVLKSPKEDDVKAKAEVSIEMGGRGPLYFPGQTAPSAAQQLITYQNVIGGTGLAGTTTIPG